MIPHKGLYLMHSVRNLLIQWANQKSIGYEQSRTYEDFIRGLNPVCLSPDEYTVDGFIDTYENKNVLIFLAEKNDEVGHLVFGAIQSKDGNGVPYHTPQFIGIESDNTPFRRCIFECRQCQSCNYINDILQYAIYFDIIPTLET